MEPGARTGYNANMSRRFQFSLRVAVMNQTARRWVLMCDEHVLGEVLHDDFENWHNNGKLIAGPDMPLYRPLFDEYRRLDRAAGDVEASNWTETTGDAVWEKQSEIDSLNLRFQDPDSGESWPIWDSTPRTIRAEYIGVFVKVAKSDSHAPPSVHHPPPALAAAGGGGVLGSIRCGTRGSGASGREQPEYHQDARAATSDGPQGSNTPTAHCPQAAIFASAQRPDMMSPSPSGDAPPA